MFCRRRVTFNVFLVAVLFVLSAVVVSAATAGPTLAGAGTNIGDGSGTTPAWTNASSVTASDDTRAIVGLVLDKISENLQATSFGFAIPASAVIDGVTVTIERQIETGLPGAQIIKDSTVKLLKAGAVVGTNMATATAWTTSDVSEAHGSSSDLWGTSWTAAEINAADFGVSVSATRTGTGAATSREARIDSIGITVTYHVPADTTPPVVTVPSDMTEQATGASGAVVPFSASAVDNVDGAITPVCVPVSGSTFSLGTTTVNCSATDSSGNTGSDTFDITVQDTTSPVFTSPPSDVTEEATSASGAIVAYGAVTADDLVDGAVNASCVPVSGSTFSLGTTPVSCTATDAAGNSDVAGFDVIVEDTTPPVISGVPADIVEEATSAAGAVVLFTDPTAVDVVDGSVSVVCTPASGSTFSLGTTTVTCDTIDAAGNSDSADFNVTVVDTTDPSITAPGDVTVEATGPSTAVALGSPVVSDLIDPSPVVINDAPGGFSVGTTTVTWTATDASGNSADDAQNVTVTDTTPPNITMLGSSPVIVTVGDPYVDDGATADDLADGDISGSIIAVSDVNTSIIGSYTVTYDVNDSSGNPAATVTRDVNVVAGPDVTAPVVTVPSDMIEEATNSSGATVSFSVTAVDDVDGALIPTCVPASDSTFGLGTTSVNCSATDLSGNTGSDTFDITVQDTTPPTITMLGSSPVNVTIGDAYVDDSATAADLVDGDVTGSIIAVSDVNESTLGTYSVVYDVNDSSGNAAATVTRTVNVVDTTPPVITLLGTDPVYVEVGLWVGYTDAGATALDDVDGDISSNVSIDTNGVGAASIGTYTVYFNVNDSSGNPALEVNRTVIVQDTTAPVITLNGSSPIDVEAGTVYVDAGAIALDDFDNVDVEHDYSGDISASMIAVSDVDTSALGAYSVVFDVNDSSGNAAVTVTRTVNVVDTTPPNITILGSNPATVTVGSSYVDANATALDNLDGNVTASIVATNGVNTVVIGSYNVTYDVTDFSGNSAQAVRTVNVVAAIAPSSGGGGGGGGNGGSVRVLQPQSQEQQQTEPLVHVTWPEPKFGKGPETVPEVQEEPPIDVVPETTPVFSGGEITGAIVGEPDSQNWLLWLALLALIALAIIGIWYSSRKNESE